LLGLQAEWIERPTAISLFPQVGWPKPLALCGRVDILSLLSPLTPPGTSEVALTGFAGPKIPALYQCPILANMAPLFRWARLIYSNRMGRRTAYWFTVIVLVALCIVALHFNLSRSASDEDGPAISLHFSWNGIPACASTSPMFELGGVPADTKLLNFTMTDLDVPTFHHGGSSVLYTGNVVKQGAITYTGPCPPQGQRHTYRWTVQALDAAGKVLGKGTAEAKFPP